MFPNLMTWCEEDRHIVVAIQSVYSNDLITCLMSGFFIGTGVFMLSKSLLN